MKYVSLIIEAGDKTSDERDLEMLKKIEVAFHTGPIIGEAREVILNISRNIMIRDLLLDSMGMNVSSRESYFKIINERIESNDREIIAKRKSNG